MVVMLLRSTTVVSVSMIVGGLAVVVVIRFITSHSAKRACVATVFGRRCMVVSEGRIFTMAVVSVGFVVLDFEAFSIVMVGRELGVCSVGFIDSKCLTRLVGFIAVVLSQCVMVLILVRGWVVVVAGSMVGVVGLVSAVLIKGFAKGKFRG